jgi:hypothetical protein
VIEMHMDGGVDVVAALVLQVGELLPDSAGGVVVDRHYHSHHVLFIVLPLALRQGIPDQVPDGLGPADVSFLRYRFVEGLQEIRFQRDAYAGDSGHMVRDERTLYYWFS